MSDCDTMEPVDLVIVAVKYTGLQSAIQNIRKCIDEHTIIMSVMNGIDSEDLIAYVYGSSAYGIYGCTGNGCHLCVKMVF